MSRQDAPLSGLNSARLPLVSDDLILLSQMVNGKLKSTYGTLAELLTHLFDGNPTVDDLLNSKGFLKTVGHNGTLTGTGTTLVPLGVKASTDVGNLIQLRDNGIYYGVEAPADISQLYVDSLLGDDNNDGTQLSPFLTLGKAMTKVNGISRQTIYLKAGDDRPDYVLSVGRTITTNGYLTFIAYGDPYIDGAINDANQALVSADPNFRIYAGLGALPIQRPRIRPIYDYVPQTNQCVSIRVRLINGAACDFIACEILLAALDPDSTSTAANTSNALINGDSSSTLTLINSVVSDNRRFPDTVGDGHRNILVASNANKIGSCNVMLQQSRLLITNPDRASDDYQGVFGRIYSFYRGVAYSISPGFGVAASQDNFYNIMDTHGEDSVLTYVSKDSTGDVLTPISDYPNFSRPNILDGYLTGITHDPTLSGTGTPSSPLRVKTSADPSNLLQIRGDGLYYGTEAPVDLSRIFVDSLLGSDSSGNGTFASPYQSIPRALMFLLKGTRQTIMLKAGDDRPTYDILGRWEIAGGQELTFDTYGDPNLDGSIANGHVAELSSTPGWRYYNPETVLEIQRPRVRFGYIPNHIIKYVFISGFQMVGGGSLNFQNINIQLRGFDPGGDASYVNWADAFFYGDPISSVNLRYCIITDNRIYPEVYSGGRNSLLSNRNDVLGVTNVIVSLVSVIVIGRPATNYVAIFGQIAALHQNSRSTVDSGFGVAVMSDNIYPVMDVYGENAMLQYVFRNSRGDVVSPVSDYQHFP